MECNAWNSIHHPYVAVRRLSGAEWRLQIINDKVEEWSKQQMAAFGLNQTLENKDLMSLLTLAWAESFTIVAIHKNSCADRG
jgi:hypothetical protein